MKEGFTQVARTKKGGILRRIVKYFLGFIIAMIIGLIINNRLCVLKYNKLDTTADVLSNDEISAVTSVYDYLDRYGDDIFAGLKENKDLIIFNDSYEFLLCDNKPASGWSFIGNHESLNKKLYRKNANNPQAFAVPVEDKWVGSMGTKNRFNKYVANAVPLFFPPQALIADDEHHRAMIIHEMVHAWQANNSINRFMRIMTLHDICQDYYDDQEFNKLIVQEAYFLEQAILAEKHEDVLAYIREFLEARERRRTVCKMRMLEIQDEVDFEWLEGLARYAEFKASADSGSMVAKNLLNIDQKVRAKGDDRYYTLGMAQALVLDKLQKEWKDKALYDNFSMEAYLKKICESNTDNHV